MADSVRRAAPRSGAEPLPESPGWFRSAVFYEVPIRSFYDADGDGIGDLRGLTSRLDYLQWLGVDCLWLLPIYASPLRDGGYDISDYRSVLPAYGDVDDFVELLDEAHRRGIRVITDLVMNHTSDQHHWFQESRRDPDGPYGDFYVWADDDRGFPDARIIFVDTEDSNWSRDRVRGQFYWHRFFSHQPDLNYDNPDVRDAMLDVVRFWLDLGIDGFRMDAVPYLFVREGTDGENLPETHDFLRLVRKVVDDEYPGRLLLAEANQWPAEAVAYFGAQGAEEMHMAFHFPLMPRIFMALGKADHGPITEVLANTPDIPPGCQWAIFLRNHDELTLEMVTEEERSYMYAEYAKEPRMRANIGIRRRLAPLLGNDRRRIELLTAMLLSLPGSPVLYYGDEIGMGDNIWLADRDGVRTPMQWTPDRNAGFSAAEPGRLAYPVVSDSTYGYTVVNVEAQTAVASSLLHWTRAMLANRRMHPVLGLGSYLPLESGNRSVLAYARQLVLPDGGRDLVLCVNNLSSHPQPADLHLPGAIGLAPVELTGSVVFPTITGSHYRLTLGGHGFLWLALRIPAGAATGEPRETEEG
ncbi:maltose alpha-D-glucosyltransferase [Actinospica sp. MGRD01-02]|uniref:maltose alpha-D-glucosyltransferase n=1 Tax=Actinospica acidithermotolerans TaxID=2828514 RepID=A0A941INJ5_9ACTN|nr:maltose alpha-D-glucosyltransferase [Actinospica acidithermotolerans]MBR7831088.1 maltose alpha-D-glucosyltransferase [Actinospica acidithermotolerans]